MYKPNVDWVVGETLSVWERCVFHLLLENRGLEVAGEYLRGVIMRRFRSGESSFVEVAEFWNLLMLPQNEFPQAHEEIQ